MCNLAEEKYRVASIMFVASSFTLADIQEKLELNQVSDAVYAILGEMVEREFIETTYQTRFLFDHQTFDFSELQAKVYQIIPSKRNEIEQYIAELDSRRLQPGIQGRPRGLNYIVLEERIEEVIAHPETLFLEEAAIEQYLALAQRDEMSERQGDPRQRAISEAYLRTLYGKYLAVKELWMEAIEQCLQSSQIFNTYGLVDEHRIAESLACETFVLEYNRVKQRVSSQVSSSTHEFEQAVNNIVSNHTKGKVHIFLALANYVLREIKEATGPNQFREGRLPKMSPIAELPVLHASSRVYTGVILRNSSYANVTATRFGQIVSHESSIGQMQVKDGKKNISSALLYLH